MTRALFLLDARRLSCRRQSSAPLNRLSVRGTRFGPNIDLSPIFPSQSVISRNVIRRNSTGRLDYSGIPHYSSFRSTLFPEHIEMNAPKESGLAPGEDPNKTQATDGGKNTAALHGDTSPTAHVARWRCSRLRHPGWDLFS